MDAGDEVAEGAVDVLAAALHRRVVRGVHGVHDLPPTKTVSARKSSYFKMDVNKVSRRAANKFAFSCLF